MLKGALVLIWELDMNLVPTPTAQALPKYPSPLHNLGTGLKSIFFYHG